MFESVVGSILSKFLGDYVDNLSGHNLELNIMSGHVVLENLQLKKEALSRYQLPVTIEYGFLGKLILDIPWKNLGKKPVQIKIQDVFVIVKPTKPSDHNSDIANKNQLDSKKRKLEIAEAIQDEDDEELNENENENKKKIIKPQGKSYSQKLIDSATSLFNVEISNIHIRYEDNLSQKNKSFSFGITLETFMAETKTGNGIEDFLQQFSAIMRNLAIYWDCKGNFLKFKSTKEMGDIMRNLIYKDNLANPPNHKYILHPICGSMDLQLNKKKTIDMDIPKLIISSTLQQINFSLREKQWKQILYFSEYFTFYSRGIKYHHIRPEKKIKPVEKPLIWWKFLLKGMKQETIKHRNKWKWETIEDHKNCRMMYIDLWKKKKYSKNTKQNNNDINSQLESLENLLPYDNIITFRKLARASYILSIDIPGTQSNNKGNGWFSWAWGTSNNIENESELDETKKDFTPDQWKKLYDEIKFIDNEKLTDKDKQSDVSEEYIKMKVNIQLETLSLTLFSKRIHNQNKNNNSNENKLINLSFNSLDVELLKRINSISLLGKISYVEMNDYCTLPGENELIEMISLNQNLNISNDINFLNVEFHQNPLHKNVDYIISIEALQSLNITFSKMIIDNLLQFFKHGSNANQLKQVANENIASVRKNASLQLQSALDHHKKIDLNIEIIAPNIIIPSSFEDNLAPVLLLELGKLKFNSKLDTKDRLKLKGDSSIDINSLKDDDFYDHFNLSLTNIKAIIFLRNENHKQLDSKYCEILSNFDILISVGVCIISEPNLPKFICKANFPSFKVLVSPSKLKKLMSIVKAYTSNNNNNNNNIKQLNDNENTNDDSLLLQNNNELVTKQQIPNNNNNNKSKEEIDNIKLLQVKAVFQFGEISTLFHKDDSDILLVSLQDFQLNATKSSHDFNAHLQLNKFFIEDRIQTIGEYKYIITSASLQNNNSNTNDLVTIDYCNVPKDSPIFQIIENTINLSFNQLDITINRETLIEVLQFTKQCLELIENNNEDQLNKLDVNEKENNNNMNDEDDNNNNKIEIIDIERKTVLFRAETSISRISVNLIANGEKFVYSALHGSTINAEAYSNKEFKFSGTVGFITIQDHSTDTIWKEIIKIDDEKILDFWFETINPQNEFDTGKIIATVEMSSIECVYLTKFIKKLANYFNEFSQMQKLLASTANKAKEKAKKQANEITKVIIYDITIANPQFIIPKSSTSKEHILTNLGDIIINNKIDEISDKNLLDCITVSISSISLESICLTTPIDNKERYKKRQVIPKSSLEVNINRAVTKELKNTMPENTIDIKIPDISISITEKQLELLFGIIYGNMEEIPPSTSQLIQETIESEIENAKQELLTNSQLIKLKEKEENNNINNNNETEISKILILLKLNLNIKKLSLELLEGNGVIVNENSIKQSSSFGIFNINNFNILMISANDKSLQVELEIQKISLIDSRKLCSSVHKNIFSIAKLKKQISLCHILYSKKVDGHQNLDVSINAPTVLLVPDFIWKLNTITSRIQNISKTLKEQSVKNNTKTKVNNEDITIDNNNNNNNKTKNNNGDDNLDNSKNDNTIKESIQQAVGISLTANIIDPELCLIEDSTKLNSRAIVMKESFAVKFSMLDGRQHALLSISDIEIYKSKLNTNNSMTTILTPFSILLNYSHTPKESLTASLEIDPIQFSLAYSDVRLLMNIRDFFLSEKTKGEHKNNNEDDNKLENESVIIKHKLQDIETEDKKVIKEHINEEIDKTIESEISNIIEKLDIRWKTISIIFLNDCNSNYNSYIQRPLMSITFDELSIDIKNWSSKQMVGYMSLTQLSIQYYNNNLNCFEPMIEPWDCYANIGKEDDIQIKLGSKQDFNINITKKFVETVLISLEQWESDYSLNLDKKNNNNNQKLKKEFHPFYIHNETGLPVSYWITNTNNKFKIENNTRQPVNINDLENISRNQFLMKNNNTIKNQNKSPIFVDNKYNPNLSIQLEDYDLIPLHNLVFLKEISYLFRDISNRDKKLRFLYKVNYEDESRIIYLGSDIIINNNTVIPLEIIIESKNIKSYTMKPLMPGCKVSIPIRYTIDSKIRVKPKDFAYEWSNNFIKCTETMKEKQPLFLVCKSKDGKNKKSPNWLYSVEKIGIRSNNLGSSHDSKRIVNINIKSPFNLENTLPCKIFYIIKDPDGLQLTGGSLNTGCKTEIHQILPDHRPILQIKISPYLPSESKKIGGNKKSVLILTSKQMDVLKILVESEQTELGARSCTLYSNYWIINQSGTKLYYQQPANRLNQAKLVKSESSIVNSSSSNFDWPVNYEPYSIEDEEKIVSELNNNNSDNEIENENEIIEDNIYAKPVIYSEKQLLIRSNHSTWSENVYLQQSGGIVNLPEKASNLNVINEKLGSYQYGIKVVNAPGKFWRTSIIYIRPYFMIINKYSSKLSFKQYNIDESKIDINSLQQVQFNWFNFKQNHQLQIKLNDDDDNNNEWSSPFFIDAASSFQLPLFIQQNEDNIPIKLRIKINVTISSVILSVWDTKNDEPDYIINNQSKFHLIIGQNETSELISLKSKSSIPYCWCVPLLLKRKLNLAISHTKVSMKINLDKLRKYKPLSWQGSNNKINTLDIEIIADGLTKILVIKDSKTIINNEITINNNNNNIKPITLEPKKLQLDESNHKQVTKPRFTLGLDLSSIGISIIDEKPQELLFINLKNIQLLYCIGDESQSIELTINNFQIDNQLYCCTFPLLLFSPPIENQPFFQLSLLRSTRYTHIRYIPYFAIKFQEIDFKIDEICLLHILKFIESITTFINSKKIKEEENKLFLCSPTYEIQLSDLDEYSGTALFFELLHINPIRINLSFEITGIKTEISSQSVLEKSLRAGGFLANIDRAPIKLNGLILENPMCSQDELISRIMKHYKIQFMTQTYKILGSIDILGNPVSLVNNLGTGVYDFFHEPIEGSVNNPREFAAGLARGTESLVKNSVFGIFNSASKISGSISKAATTISLDDNWKQSRLKKYSKPNDVTSGLSSGMKKLGSGLFDGFTGIVSQPIKGLSEEGGSGLAIGVGKGITGLFLKPVVGVVDLITDTTEGIKNYAEYAEYVKERKRIPRYFGKNNILYPYDISYSLPQYILRTIEDGRFDKHYFLESWPISPNSFILLSDKRVFNFTKSKAQPKKNWSIPIPEIKDINMVDSGVCISSKNGKTLIFESRPGVSEKITSSVWKLITKHRTKKKELEYHLTEDRSNIRKPKNKHTEQIIIENSYENIPLLNKQTFSDIPYDEYASDDSVASINIITEKTPLVSPNKNGGKRTTITNPSTVNNNRNQPQKRVRRKPQKQEDEGCCSCCIS